MNEYVYEERSHMTHSHMDEEKEEEEKVRVNEATGSPVRRKQSN